MSATRENEQRLALLLQQLYPSLKAREVSRLLDHAERVKKGLARQGQFHTKSGRELTVETFVYAER